jgi:hypothetical protein
VGPANVSSQSLSRNPIIIMLLLKHKLRFFFE